MRALRRGGITRPHPSISIGRCPYRPRPETPANIQSTSILAGPAGDARLLISGVVTESSENRAVCESGP